MKEPQKRQVSLTDEQWAQLEETGESTYNEQYPVISGSGRYKQFEWESDPIPIKSADDGEF
jgi:hypothetical protein